MSLKAIIWAWDQSVDSSVTKLILLKLADNADEDTGTCFPSHSTIAKHCGCSRRTVIRNIKKLQEQGFLTKKTRVIDNKKTSNIYTLNLENTPLVVTESHMGVVTESHMGVVTESHIGVVTESHIDPVSILTSKSIIVEHSFSDDDLVLANFMFKKIQDLNKTQKQPNFEKWARTIRLIRERDKKTHKDIQDLFIWANNNPFWQANILSPAKLRKKWDRLIIQRDSKHEKNKPCCSGGALQQANQHSLDHIKRLEAEESLCPALDVTPKPLRTSGVQ